jgi:hypothetical protein
MLSLAFPVPPCPKPVPQEIVESGQKNCPGKGKIEPGLYRINIPEKNFLI